MHIQQDRKVETDTQRMHTRIHICVSSLYPTPPMSTHTHTHTQGRCGVSVGVSSLGPAPKYRASTIRGSLSWLQVLVWPPWSPLCSEGNRHTEHTKHAFIHACTHTQDCSDASIHTPALLTYMHSNEWNTQNTHTHTHTHTHAQHYTLCYPNTSLRSLSSRYLQTWTLISCLAHLPTPPHPHRLFLMSLSFCFSTISLSRPSEDTISQSPFSV